MPEMDPHVHAQVRAIEAKIRGDLNGVGPLPAAADPDGWTGAELLDAVLAAFTKYVVFPSVEAAHAAVLWTAATHGIKCFEHAPRLVASSAVKRSGKSRLMDLVGETCHKPIKTFNASTSAVFRSIGGDPPTLLVDEADAIFGTKRAAENNEDLRGLLNAGHQRGRVALRCVGPLQTPTPFPTFAMAMLACIGSMPDTIEDRAIVIRLRRRAPDEAVAPYRTRRDQSPLNKLRDQLAAWIAANEKELENAEPAMPLEDRAADTWEPLFAVAELAGGAWPARASRAAVKLVTEADEADGEASLALQLLRDIKETFDGFRVSFLSSQMLVTALCKLDDSPWRDDFLTTAKLGQMLRGFGVRPGHNSAGSARGYRLETFHDTFRRYLRQNPSGPVNSASDLRERSDALKPSDGSGRQTVLTRQKETAGQTANRRPLTPSDAPPGGPRRSDPDGVCVECGEAMFVYEPDQTTHPSCDPSEVARSAVSYGQ